MSGKMAFFILTICLSLILTTCATTGDRTAYDCDCDCYECNEEEREQEYWDRRYDTGDYTWWD